MAADRAEIEALIRKADAAGDADSVRVLFSELDKLETPQAPVQPQQAPVSGIDRAAAIPAGFNRGLLNTLGLPMQTLTNLGNLGSAGLGYLHSKITGQPAPESIYAPVDPANVPLTGDWLNRIANSTPAGNVSDIPRPDDVASRHLFAAGQGASAVAVPGSGVRILPTLASGVAGAEASQVAAESGADPATQAVAGLVGGMAPSAARYGWQEGVRQLARGKDPQVLRQNIADFAKAGTTPSVGQGTQNRRTQATETLLSRTPGSAGVMTNRAEQQAAQIGSKIEQLGKSLSPRSTPEEAGRAIQKGVVDSGGFIDQFKTKSSANYNQLDKFIKPDTAYDVTNTQAALAKLTTPIKGAEKTSSLLSNSKIAGINQALADDLAANGGKLPYKAVKELRTMIGDQLADAPLAGDVPTAQWKQLYAALSKDMEAAAKLSGPQAEQALRRANTYHKVGLNRIDLISSVVEKNGGPEKVFQAATNGTKEGATVLRSVMRSLPEDAQKSVSAAMLRRLGRAKPGQQNDVGDKFSTETFLTNWNSLSKEAKSTLFDRYGPNFRSDMDAVARVADNLRQGSKVFVNPSGTSQGIGQMTAATAFLTSLFTGNIPAAAGVAAGVGGANRLAAVMTNPKAVAWLAMTTRAPSSKVPLLIQQAAMSNDPDIREIARLAKEQGVK